MSTIYIECPSRPKRTLYDLTADLGLSEAPVKPKRGAWEGEWFRYKRELAAHEELIERQKATIVEPSSSPLFICGDVEPEPFCPCGHTSEFLCDHPMGAGGTCDLKLCWCCRRNVGEELDLCAIHFAEFVRKTGVERINRWPPRRE